MALLQSMRPAQSLLLTFDTMSGNNANEHDTQHRVRGVDGCLIDASIVVLREPVLVGEVVADSSLTLIVTSFVLS